MSTENTTEKTRLTRIVPPYFQDLVTLRILKSTYTKSGAGNPMITWFLEILKPLEFELDGTIYSLDGMGTIPVYLVKSAKRDDFSLLRSKIHPKLGLPEEIDEDNPNTDQYNGIVFQSMLYSIEDFAQRRLPNGQLEVIKDANGKSISKGWKFLFKPEEIVGLASADENTPY